MENKIKFLFNFKANKTINFNSKGQVLSKIYENPILKIDADYKYRPFFAGNKKINSWTK